MRRTKGQRKGQAGLSPRAYQALLDRRKLWQLVCMETPQVQIAQMMGKDPAWVSRTVQEIKADFSTVHATPNESSIIRENLAQWESLLAEALRNVHNSTGYSRISALRAAAEIHRQKAEYEISVGWVVNRRYGNAEPWKPTMGNLAVEFAPGDLEAIFLTVSDDIRQRQAKEAKVKEIAAFPEVTTSHS